MFFRLVMTLAALVLSVMACVPLEKVRKMRTGELQMGLSVRDEVERDLLGYEESVVDSVAGNQLEGPILMNAIRDDETGEMVATDIISASKVTARFRNVAERAGYVTIGFDIMIPEEMMDARWQLKILPSLHVLTDTVPLQPLYITGNSYRNFQLRGYQRYQAFLSSIVTDTTDLIRMGQLELFLERHFPATYAMKSDSSIVSEPMAENLFGVSQIEAVRHYTRNWKVRRNEWKKRNRLAMFRKYVKDPIMKEGIRLDTLMTADGDFIYQYSHTFRSRPGLKKVQISLKGYLYESGECLMELPFPDDLTFYISTLSSLADTSGRYVVVVLDRVVNDHTKALIDFDKASYAVDTLREDNASELRRIERCIGDVAARGDLILDSLVITASCSPEGAYEYNKVLSQARSESVLKVIGQRIPEDMRPMLKTSSKPENWSQLQLLVSNDTVISTRTKRAIEGLLAENMDYDLVEEKMLHMKEYKYLREKIYPQLRSVCFDFYLHRKGVVKDTVHTHVLDTIYMKGLDALKRMDYSVAVELLRPYADYNAALALLSSGYNHSALEVLRTLDVSDAKVCYLMAMTLERIGKHTLAMEYFNKALELAPSLEFRANLDPEMSELVRKRNKANEKVYNE